MTSQHIKTNNLPVVGLVMKSLAAEFFQRMRAGAIAHVQQRGDLHLLPVGTQTQTEVNQQVELVAELVDQKIDAMVIMPIDSQALVLPVVKAVQAGVRVINADVMLDKKIPGQHDLDLPFLGPDNAMAAKVVGDILGRYLGPKGNVIVIEGIPEASNARQRYEGFRLAIQEHNLNLLTSRTAHWETQEAYTVFSDLLETYPEVQGVMCANDAMALGVLQAIEAHGKTGQIVAVGIDNDESIHPRIEDKQLLATVDLLGPDMIIRAIDYAMEALSGRVRRGWIKTPVRVITRESLTQLSF